MDFYDFCLLFLAENFLIFFQKPIDIQETMCYNTNR